MNSISKMNSLSKESVTWLEIEDGDAGQRIDNYLIKRLKGVPKSHVYRILRSGEVRVNSGRVDAAYRVASGDRIRVPPIRIASRPGPAGGGGKGLGQQLGQTVLYEDDSLLVINKPAGFAVHGGSGISRGVIEQLRLERPTVAFLELAHRLDRETSGVLILCKKRSALTALHQAMREGQIDKRYLALVQGYWKNVRQNVRFPLHKYVTPDGERRVAVQDGGQAAHTVFILREAWPQASLLEAELKTGRTHQIRVHLAHLGFPIAGDDKYGDFAWNKTLHKSGLKRMFLHAWKLEFRHPLSGEWLHIEAPLPEELSAYLAVLSRQAGEPGDAISADSEEK